MWYEDDPCYECVMDGDDWIEDENGELHSRCEGCPFSPFDDPEEEW